MQYQLTAALQPDHGALSSLQQCQANFISLRCVRKKKSRHSSRNMRHMRHHLSITRISHWPCASLAPRANGANAKREIPVYEMTNSLFRGSFACLAQACFHEQACVHSLCIVTTVRIQSIIPMRMTVPHGLASGPGSYLYGAVPKTRIGTKRSEKFGTGEMPPFRFRFRGSVLTLGLGLFSQQQSATKPQL
jgi:hypothetical protein